MAADTDGRGPAAPIEDGASEAPAADLTDSHTAAPMAGAILDKLAALDMQRRAEREKRREDALAVADPRESIAQFLASFTTRQQAVEQGLARITAASQPGGSTPGDAAAAAAAASSPEAAQSSLDGLAAEVLSLEQSAADASYYLPPYDQKHCAATVAALRASIEAARVALAPRKRFAFSKKVAKVSGEQISGAAASSSATLAAAAAGAAAAAAAAAGNQVMLSQSASDSAAGGAGAAAGSAPGAGGVAPVSERDAALVAAGRGLLGLCNSVIVKRADEVSGQDWVLINCTGCTIYLLGQLAALRLAGLRGCRVYAGPVTGACFVDDIQGCTLALATYQTRIHRAHQSDLFLRLRSRPIIEHSTGLRFAPLSAALSCTAGSRLSTLLQQHRLGDGDDGAEAWSQVDDFGWIKTVQSPNWRIMADAERPEALHEVPAEVWAPSSSSSSGDKSAAGGQRAALGGDVLAEEDEV